MMGRLTFASAHIRVLLSFLVTLAQLSNIQSEIIQLDMIIDASSVEVHFVRGFLQAPASVDLSFVRLITNEEPLFTYFDDEYALYEDEDDEFEDDEFEDGDADEYEYGYPASSPFDSDSNEDTSIPIGGDDYIGESEGKSDTTYPPDEESTETPVAAPVPSTVVPSGDRTNNKVGKPNGEGNNDVKNEEEDVVEPSEPFKNEGSNEGNESTEENNNEKKEEDEEDNVEPSESITSSGGENESEEEDETTSEEGYDTVENETPAKEDYESEDIPIDTPFDTRNNTMPEGKGGTTPDDVKGEKTPDDLVEGNEGNDTGDDQVEETTPTKEGIIPDPTSTTNAPPEEYIPDPTSSPTSNGVGGRNRVLDRDQNTATSGMKQIADIVLFLVPGDCQKDIWGTCDWVTLGIGAYDDEMEGGMSYCCSKDTAERGNCNFDDVGTLIVDHSIFNGEHRLIDVPSLPLQDFSLDDPKFDVQVSGDYVMVIANCNDDGLSVITLGSMEWKSVGGFLPGDIFGLMFFYAGLAAIYFVVMLWYYFGMKMYQEAAIPIQKYILATMVLGFLEISFLGIDLFIWNITGLRSPGVAYTALGLGVLKRGSSRCLGVMVAMGWGVVRDSLGTTLIKILALGLLYSGLTLAIEFLEIAAVAVQKKSLEEEEELLNLALVLAPIIFIINIIFYCWIISSLSSTTEYLRNMNQTSKLRRHMRLRCLIITSLVVVGIVLALEIAQRFIYYFSQDQMWILQAVTHANYLFILFGVGILWRPNSHAKDYAMQMEVPAMGEDDENELELSCVVPSAEDIDDDNGFKIDDAVAT
mmetsp:Transcript_23423/g.26104  ORF Transcript_23423/g.26104 Transcript_23423/m.26104 type:complete len:810 (+) Transcript_23423:83-2512(+)